MAPQLEERMAKIEGSLEQINLRFSSVESRLSSVESRLDSQFKWIVGIQLTTWVTLMLAVLFR
jgi:hypothetical protein